MDNITLFPPHMQIIVLIIIIVLNLNWLLEAQNRREGLWEPGISLFVWSIALIATIWTLLKRRSDARNKSALAGIENTSVSTGTPIATFDQIASLLSYFRKAEKLINLQLEQPTANLPKQLETALIQIRSSYKKFGDNDFQADVQSFSMAVEQREFLQALTSLRKAQLFLRIMLDEVPVSITTVFIAAIKWITIGASVTGIFLLAFWGFLLLTSTNAVWSWGGFFSYVYLGGILSLPIRGVVFMIEYLIVKRG